MSLCDKVTSFFVKGKVCLYKHKYLWSLHLSWPIVFANVGVAFHVLVRTESQKHPMADLGFLSSVISRSCVEQMKLTIYLADPSAASCGWNFIQVGFQDLKLHQFIYLENFILEGLYNCSALLSCNIIDRLQCKGKFQLLICLTSGPYQVTCCKEQLM